MLAFLVYMILWFGCLSSVEKLVFSITIALGLRSISNFVVFRGRKKKRQKPRGKWVGRSNPLGWLGHDQLCPPRHLMWWLQLHC